MTIETDFDKTTHNIPSRSARNRIIDLLGIGDTYPLTDLNVVADQLKVPFDGIAEIPIEHAQAGFKYQLCDPSGQSLGGAFQKDGNDTRLMIDSPNVSKDVTYRIQVTKHALGHTTLAAQTGPRYLDEHAPVKVGIDSTLAVSFKEPHPLLFATIRDPIHSDPRIVPYGTVVDIQVDNTQKGVEYSLELNGNAQTSGIFGDLKSIVLQAPAMHEDSVIKVRATKHFHHHENRADETTLLDASLYLKVMANPKLGVSIVPSAIIAYQGDTELTVSASQKSTQYRAYMRKIADTDFVRGPTDADVVTVTVNKTTDVQVQQPTLCAPWQTPDGYSRPSEEFIPGTGADIQFKLQAMADDSLFIIEAIKEHQLNINDPESEIIRSSISLLQAAAVLVQPDPTRELTLRIPISDANSGDCLKVSGGQPGVFYSFHPLPDGPEFPLPAYFHQRDGQQITHNKGVDQLGVEIDFVIADDVDTDASGQNLASTPPPWPILDITPFASDSELLIRAYKAQTSVEVSMAAPALIAAVPAIHAKASVIDYSSPATILIPASHELDRYQFTRIGTSESKILNGSGDELRFVSQVLNTDAVFEVVVTRLEHNGLHIERVLPIPVFVRPDATLVVTARQDTVVKDTATEISVQASQLGVDYQLMIAVTSVGPAVQGTGAQITLPTGPISVDTPFTVRATRTDLINTGQTEIAVILNTPVRVEFAINTQLGVTFKAPLLPLDPSNENPQAWDPRRVAYGSSVDIQVDNTQKDVSYSLFVDGRKWEQTVAGNQGSIILSTGDLFDDALIQVKASKVAFTDKNTQAQSTLLDTSLYLCVMANPELVLSVEPASIIAYAQDASIRIISSQSGVKYKAYVHQIADIDFMHGRKEGELVTVTVAEKDDVKILKPTLTQPWRTPQAYQPLSDEFTPGTGGDIELSVKGLIDDSLVIVQALKEHQPEADKAFTISSSIGLLQVVAILVQPDPALALKLRVAVIEGKTTNTLQVFDGQPGVFYYFRLEPEGVEFPQAAYFHQRDGQQITQNKGVDQLGVEIDFVIANDVNNDASGQNPASTTPALPIINITPVATNRSVFVRAQKAQTAVDTKMNQKALIAVVPKIIADPVVIDYGKPANIAIPASNKLDQYQVMLLGVPVQSALTGDSKKLTVVSQPLTADAVFEVVVTRLEHNGLHIERVLPIPVFVRPNATLVVTANQDTVVKDTATEIIVQGSQSCATYQLMSGETPVGPAVQGTGAQIALPTGPISVDTSFTVRATRTDKTDIAQQLQTTVNIKVADDV
jgi:hypothetical protein